MENHEVEKIKTQTTHNILFLTLRNFGIQGISALGFFLLTILLGTGDVGLFAIVAESIGILGYFSDVGLASALIQQKDEPDKVSLRTTFTIQQLLVLLCLISVAIFYPQLSNSKGYGSKEMWIMLSLCFSFVAASLKTIPSVKLERHLNFKLISTIDILENTLFYLIAVLFAFLGFGVYSYAIATFIKSLVGLVVIYRLAPWDIGFAFSLKTAKTLFSFGIPFQLNSLISMAKDRFSTLLVAGILGRQSFGLLSWAQKGPRIPLSFMDAIMRVTFPTFSRLQEEKEFLKKSLEKSTFFIALIVFPSLLGICLIAPEFIDLIPKYNKWSPAIIPLYFFAASYAIASVTTPITNAFNATGKIKTTTKLMIMWTVLTWIFYPILSLKFGYMGTSVAALIVGLSSFIVWYLAKKYFDVNILKTIYHPLVASLSIFLITLPISYLSLSPLISIILKILLSVSVYSIYQFVFNRSELIWFYQQLLKVKK
ncbi:MAG TPA: oligosaccharide flippase family protein [Candidatus Methanoperedens sp.]|nr:oligosaccharide flippase family protein [Candidatus Methanoperedens sp.]